MNNRENSNYPTALLGYRPWCQDVLNGPLHKTRGGSAPTGDAFITHPEEDTCIFIWLGRISWNNKALPLWASAIAIPQSRAAPHQGSLLSCPIALTHNPASESYLDYRYAENPETAAFCFLSTTLKTSCCSRPQRGTGAVWSAPLRYRLGPRNPPNPITT